MTREEFVLELKPMFEVFGTAEYPKVRLDLIFEDVNDLTRFEFRRIVKHFNQTRPVKSPPLPTHFNEQAQDVRKHRTSAQVERLVSEATRSSDEKYQSFLEAMGASSLVEAIEKGKWK